MFEWPVSFAFSALYASVSGRSCCLTLVVCLHGPEPMLAIALRAAVTDHDYLQGRADHPYVYTYMPLQYSPQHHQLTL